MLHLFHFILYALWFGVFIFAISWWKFFDIEEVGRPKLIAFFAFKVWAGLVLTLVYTYYYTDPSKADIYRYFHDSKIISSVLFTNPKAWFKIITSFGALDNESLGYISNTLHYSHPANDMVTSNSFIIRIISLLNYFSLYNIYINTLLLNFMGFIGLTALFKSVKPYFKKVEWALYIPVYLLPSVVFWSSGLLKESLLIPAIGGYIYACLKLTGKLNRRMILLLFAMLFVVALTKIYVAVFLVFCTPVLVLSKAKRTQVEVGQWLLAVFFATMLVAFLYFWGCDICSKIIDKRNEFIQLALVENAGSLLDTTIASPDCSHVLALLPSSVVNAVLRPFLWDNGNVLQLLFAIENFVFIAVIVMLPLFFFKKPDASKLWFSIFCFSFAMLNYLLIGLTIPVMGAIVHYRVVAMPFLLLSALLLTDFSKLQQVLPKFKFSGS